MSATKELGFVWLVIWLLPFSCFSQNEINPLSSALKNEKLWEKLLHDVTEVGNEKSEDVEPIDPAIAEDVINFARRLVINEENVPLEKQVDEFIENTAQRFGGDIVNNLMRRFKRSTRNCEEGDASCNPNLDSSLLLEAKKGANQCFPWDPLVINTTLNWVRDVASNQGTLPFKERIVNILKYIPKCYDYGSKIRVKLRFNQTDCKRDNQSCDPIFDSVFFSMPKETRMIRKIEPRMKSGKTIEIVGMIPVGSQGFTATVQTGYERPIEGQLRVNVKFSYTGTKILLEYYNGNWNLFTHLEGHLKTEEIFSITIACLDSFFEVYINKKFVASVDHVLEYRGATHLSIIGMVNITDISGVKDEYLPIDAYKPSKTWLDDKIQYQINPQVPFVAPLASRLEPGRSIEIRGVIPLYSKRFAITIQTGSDFDPEIAYLRILVDFLKNNQKVISTWYYDGSDWKGEELQKPVLTAGYAFHIIITCSAGYFQISADGRTFATYDYHQLPINRADHLSILGMVNITEVIGINKVPLVQFLNKSVVSPYVAPLENVSLVPGRKLKVWTYIPEKSSNFSMHLTDAKNETFYVHLEFIFTKKSSAFEWNTYQTATWGKKLTYGNLTWLNQGQPLQFEISCLNETYKIIYFGLWEYTFEYRLPLNKTARIEFPNNGLVIHAVDGVNSKPPPPPPSPPESRVCEAVLWYGNTESDVNIMLYRLYCSLPNPRNQSSHYS